MSWNRGDLVCDGCRAPIEEKLYAVSIRHALDGEVDHYHQACWQTGWYTGIEPKGEWPIAEPVFDHIGKQPEDPVNSPSHYKQLPNGIEVIDVTENFDFLIGNVLKYVLRAEYKGKPLEDWKKARWYLDRAIARRESGE